jgi:hypothetical protein
VAEKALTRLLKQVNERRNPRTKGDGHISWAAGHDMTHWAAYKMHWAAYKMRSRAERHLVGYLANRMAYPTRRSASTPMPSRPPGPTRSGRPGHGA